MQNLEKQTPDLSEEEIDDYLFTVESVSALHTKDSPKKIFANVQLKGETLKFQLECDATVNILPVDVYKQIYHDPQITGLQPSQTTLLMFNKWELKPLAYTAVNVLKRDLFNKWRYADWKNIAKKLWEYRVSIPDLVSSLPPSVRFST